MLDRGGSGPGAWLWIACAALALGCASTPEEAPDMVVAQSAAAERVAWTELTPDEAVAFPLDETYRLQIGDQLNVRFVNHPELDEQVVVRPDGRIAIPLAGSVMAAGHTPNEVERALVERLSPVLLDPEPAVIVLDYPPIQVFVGGEVAAPGLFPMPARLTVLQAMTLAGGPLVTGQLKNVVLIRQRLSGPPAFIRIDMHGHLRGEADDVALRPNDVVFVPKTRIARVNEFVDQYFEELFEIDRDINIFWLIP